MTIGTNNRNDAVGNDAATTYPYGFKIFAATDLEVTVRDLSNVETVLTYPTHYSVTGIGIGAGGNVVLVDVDGAWQNADGTLKNGYAITARRVRPLSQSTDIRNQGGFFAATHEDTFDHLAMVDQQQQEQINRSLRLVRTEAGSAALTELPVDRGGKYLAFDADKKPIASAGTGADTALRTDLAATTGSTLVGFIQGFVNSVIVSVKTKLGLRIDVEDFGAVCDGVTDDSAAFLKAIAYMNTRNAGLSGGIIHAWGLKYKVSEVVMKQSHVMIEGRSAGYAYNDQAYGTTFLCTSGKYAFALLYDTVGGTSALGSGLRKCSIMSTAVDATAVEYGVLISASATVMEDVTVIGFKRNISGLNWDANKFKRVACLWGTQTGFEITHGASMAHIHPNVLTELTGMGSNGSTTWTGEDMLIRRNYVGAVIRDGNAASMVGCVIEGNYHHGMIIFTTADGSNQHGPNYYNFRQVHFEGNFMGWAGADSSKYSLSDYNGLGDGVLACKTSATEYLKGDITGEWQSSQTAPLVGSDANDAGYDVWIGSATEAAPTPGVVELYYLATTLCYGHVFEDCAFATGGGSVKVRSGNHIKLKHCSMYYGGQNGSSFGVNLTAYAQHTMLEDVTSRVDDLTKHTNATVIITRQSGGYVQESFGAIIADKGTFIAKKKSVNTTVVTSIGEYIIFNPGVSKEITFGGGSNAGGFMFLLSRTSDGDGGLFFASYASATITKLAGGAGFIVGAAAGAAEVATTKAAGTNTVSVKTGSGFTGQLGVEMIGTTCTLTTDPA